MENESHIRTSGVSMLVVVAGTLLGILVAGVVVMNASSTWGALGHYLGLFGDTFAAVVVRFSLLAALLALAIGGCLSNRFVFLMMIGIGLLLPFVVWFGLIHAIGSRAPTPIRFGARTRWLFDLEHPVTACVWLLSATAIGWVVRRNTAGFTRRAFIGAIAGAIGGVVIATIVGLVLILGPDPQFDRSQMHRNIARFCLDCPLLAASLGAIVMRDRAVRLGFSLSGPIDKPGDR